MSRLNRREMIGLTTAAAFQAGAGAAPPGHGGLQRKLDGFAIPPDYLREPETITGFWVSSFAEVGQFLDTQVRKGSVRTIGRSAGGSPIRAVVYGRPRVGRGTTTFSGSLGYGDVRAWLGPDYAKQVYLAMSSVHGGEFEGIVGVFNLISVLETGADLRGRAWPGIKAPSAALARI